MEVLVIIGVGAFFIVSWIIQTQNSLVNIDELCNNALSQVGVQQTSRWDVLSNLAELIAQYSEYESNALIQIIQQRGFSQKFNSISEIEQNEQLLTQAFSKINAVMEAYPQLKADALYLDTMNSMRELEENVRYARMMYNDVITKYNRQVKMIPTCFIAGMLGFRKRYYLLVDTAKTDMPNMRRK